MGSIKEQIDRLKLCARNANLIAANFFANGLSRAAILKITDEAGISLTEESIDFFEEINGMVAPPDRILEHRRLVMNHGLMDISESCSDYRISVDHGGMSPELFPILTDYAGGLICVAQRDAIYFRLGEVVFWDPEFGIKGRLKSLDDFISFVCISLDQCYTEGHAFDLECTIVNANKHAKMVDPAASVLDLNC
jgi:hypothetical protein